MIKRLRIAFKNSSSQQGFAIPIAVGMGLIMILIGTTMVMRSQGDEVTASAQKATADSFNVAELGVTRVQSLIKRFPKMAEKSKSEWAAEYNRLSALNTCLSNTQDSDLTNNINTWINVDSSDPKKGEIKILDYTYSGNVGTLKIAGRARSESGSATTSIDNANTYLVVEIPVVTLENLPVPGLWAKDFTMGNNDVKGNVLVTGCSIPAGITAANIVAGSGSLTANPSVEYPPLPALPAVCPSGTATTPCYQVFKQNNAVYDPTATNADAITNTYVKDNGTKETECLKDSQGYVVTEDNKGNLVRVQEKGNYVTGCTDSSHYATTTSLTFPRANDKAGSDGVYRYLIAANSNNSIELKGGNKIKITDGEKVVFYLQGNIDISGQSQIIHTGSPPTNFQIYGSDGGRHYRTTSDANTYTTSSIMLSGNTSANMFLYAPEATAGVNGGGNVTSTITGSVWVKAWDGSNANQLVVTQTAAWINLPLDKPKRVSSIRSWKRASN